MADYRYIIGPWIWRDDSTGGGYGMPAGAVSGIDLGSLPAMSVVAPSRPSGLFWLRPDAPFDAGIYADLGHGDCRDMPTDAAMISAWESMTGYRPAGDRLVGLVFDHLTTGADPSGEDGPGPLRPTRGGELIIVMHGHSVVWRQRFRWGEHPHWQKVRDRYRRDLLRARLDTLKGTIGRDADFHRRFATSAVEVLRGSGMASWNDLRPGGWPAGERPRPRRTSHEDTFDRADQDPLGTSSGGQSWTDIRGDWEIISNSAGIGTDGQVSAARLEADVSSDGHYAYGTISTLSFVSSARSVAGPYARMSASAETGYRFQVENWNTYYTLTLNRVTGGSTTTDIGGPTNTTDMTLPGDAFLKFTEGDAYETRWRGSTIHTGTDTTHTGYTRTGLIGFEGTGTTARVDYLIIDDEIAAGISKALRKVMHYRRGS